MCHNGAHETDDKNLHKLTYKYRTEFEKKKKKSTVYRDQLDWTVDDSSSNLI